MTVRRTSVVVNMLTVVIRERQGGEVRRLLLGMVLVLVVALTAPAANAAGSTVASFGLPAGDGYFVSVEGHGRRVVLTVNGHEVITSYVARGRASSQRIEATFGKLGRISVRFKPGDHVRRDRPPKSCKGKPQVTRFGVFVGAIRFDGERDYVGLRSRRVKGSVESAPAWRCGKREKGGGQARGSKRGGAAPAPPVMAAYASRPRLLFAAIGDDPSAKELDFTIFIAGMVERREAMRIARATFTLGGPRSFIREGNLESAVVHPPEPFDGGARYTRNSDGSFSWTGSLSFPFPGIGRVAFTGPQFTADLARPQTNAEARKLFGIKPDPLQEIGESARRVVTGLRELR